MGAHACLNEVVLAYRTHLLFAQEKCKAAALPQNVMQGSSGIHTLLNTRSTAAALVGRHKLKLQQLWLWLASWLRRISLNEGDAREVRDVQRRCCVTALALGTNLSTDTETEK